MLAGRQTSAHCCSHDSEDRGPGHDVSCIQIRIDKGKVEYRIEAGQLCRGRRTRRPSRHAPCFQAHVPSVRRPQKFLPPRTSVAVAPLVLSAAGAAAMISSVVFVDAVVGPATGSVKVAPRFTPAAPVLSRLQISPSVNLALASSFFGPAGGVNCPSIMPGTAEEN